MLNLLLACAFVQIVADGWLWELIHRYQGIPLLKYFDALPSRLILAYIFTSGMLLFIVFRAARGSCLSADRGMFVLGCGAASGFAADVLKFVFGRSYPSSSAISGFAGYQPFNSEVDLCAFPSAHAAIAAGLAGALAIVWPSQRRIFILLGAVVAGSRFLTGLHYPSDVLLGFATGLGIVVMLCIIFFEAGICLHEIDSDRR